MIEEKRKANRRRQVEAIKRLGRHPNGRGLLLHGLWACRVAAGMSQRHLAGLIGTNQGTIHELETLARGAYPKTITKLSAALDVDPADLLCAEATDKEEQ